MPIEFSNELEAPATTPALPRNAPAALPFYWLSIFLGAFLLFAVQLILGKYFLPWFGGTPAMWTTCLFFFQSLLVLGYLYAHFLADRIPFHLQGTSHAMVLACVLGLTLSLALKCHSPLLPDPSCKPVGSEH